MALMRLSPFIIASCLSWLNTLRPLGWKVGELPWEPGLSMHVCRISGELTLFWIRSQLHVCHVMLLCAKSYCSQMVGSMPSHDTAHYSMFSGQMLHMDENKGLGFKCLFNSVPVSLCFKLPPEIKVKRKGTGRRKDVQMCSYLTVTSSVNLSTRCVRMLRGMVLPPSCLWGGLLFRHAGRVELYAKKTHMHKKAKENRNDTCKWQKKQAPE